MTLSVLLFIDAGLQVDARQASICVTALDSLGKLIHAYGSQFSFREKL